MLRFSVGASGSWESSQILQPLTNQPEKALKELVKLNGDYGAPEFFIGIVFRPKTGASEVPRCFFHRQRAEASVEIELEYRFVMSATPEQLGAELERGVIRAIEFAKARLGKRGKDFDSECLVRDLQAYFSQHQLWSKEALQRAHDQRAAVAAQEAEQTWEQRLYRGLTEIDGIGVFSSEMPGIDGRDLAQPIRLSDALKQYASVQSHAGEWIAFVRPDNHRIRFIMVDEDTQKVELYLPGEKEAVWTDIAPEDGNEMINLFFRGRNLDEVYVFEGRWED